MAMMAKMRSLAPAFIITVGALFVLFMVISDSNVLEALGGRTNNVGSVNGTEISYKDFQLALDRQRETTKQQTGQEIPDEQWDQFREQVWDAMVTQTLLSHEIEKLGISVSDEEVKDKILGDDPPPFLKQSFVDSLGQFNRAAYENAIFDPKNEQILLQTEEFVRQTTLNEKLQSMMLASITVTEDEVMRKFKEQNVFVNTKYAFVNAALFPDSLIKINDDNLIEYYETNADEFKVNAQRKFKYVLFRNQASAADTELILNNLENVRKILIDDTADFKSFVELYSDQPYSVDTISVSNLVGETANELGKMESGDISNPLPAQDGYTIYHLLKTLDSGNRFVKASHILISNKGDDAANLAEANRIYNELISGANFSKLAKEFSGDPGSAANGGELGWFGRGAMVKEFDEACFNAPLNVVQKPIKTTFGYHIIKVTDQSTKSYVVERIVNQVKLSATTRDEIFNAANDFSYLADNNGFEKEAEIMNYAIQESPPFAEKSASIPGLGANRGLVTFAFENGLGSISNAYKLPNGYVVAKISEVSPEGRRDFEEVKTQIQQKVLSEKRFEMANELAKNLSSKVNGKIDQINILDPRVPVRTTGRINAQSNIPNIGKDATFINAVFSLGKNKLSEPVKGLRGYYLIEVTEKTEFDSSAYKLQSSTIRNNIYQQKRNSYLNVWIQKLKDEADIVDNRYMFYGY